jgi:hypothetical protein
MAFKPSKKSSVCRICSGEQILRDTRVRIFFVRRTFEQPWVIAKRDRNLLTGRASSRIVYLDEQVVSDP